MPLEKNRTKQFIKELREALEFVSDKEHALGAATYMKNKFIFFGIYTNQRRVISNSIIKQFGIFSESELNILVKELYKQPEREFQYVAIELIAFHKKYWTKELIELTEHCIVNKSWWDSVDHIASLILGPYFKKFPEQIIPITNRWNNSENFWLQRSSIMFQKAYKTETDTNLLGKYILNVRNNKEFFVQKAIGWALREYGKTNPSWVKNFVQQNQLTGLSAREALRRIV
ncbi:MAG: DNA alkylation repair protein [Chitinophagaceae bacterium]|nr:DNA alkylation repair protein [Chitinophagaceae bacterium]